MLNRLCRYLISRSLDTGAPVPPWAARRIERTPELREFRDSVDGLDRSLHAGASHAVDEVPPFLTARVRARIGQAETPEPAPARAWRQLAPVLGACGLLAGVFVAARFMAAPATPPAHRRPLGELFARMRVPAPEDVARSLELPMRARAMEAWDETRAAFEVVVARLPSPPSLRRAAEESAAPAQDPPKP